LQKKLIGSFPEKRLHLKGLVGPLNFIGIFQDYRGYKEGCQDAEMGSWGWILGDETSKRGWIFQ
jgi:hypothetical protein